MEQLTPELAPEGGGGLVKRKVIPNGFLNNFFLSHNLSFTPIIAELLSDGLLELEFRVRRR
jgi:hypothetical protein